MSVGYTGHARRRRADVERPLRERVYEHLARAWRVFWRLALGSLKKLDFPTTEYPTTENQNQKRQ